MTDKATAAAVQSTQAAAAASSDLASPKAAVTPLMPPTPPTAAGRPAPKLPDGPLPIRMLSDRLLVMLDAEAGDRRSSGGILIPVTAEVGKRLAWAFVVAAGSHVRQIKVGDRVLFDPADRAEVELSGQTYLLLRERDAHGVAQDPADQAKAGLYL